MTPIGLESLRTLLRSPFAFEDLADQPWVVVDLANLPAPTDHALRDEVRSGLLDVPAVTVALAHTAIDERDAALVGAFDVVLAPPDLSGAAMVASADPGADVARLIERVAASPGAAVALVQLLRLSAELSVTAALAAESFAYSTLQSGPEFARWLAHRRAVEPDPRRDPAVQVERTASTIRLTLDRPERRNAVSAAMRDELVAALRVAVSDPSVDGVVLSGAGPAFCAGGDLAEFGTTPDPATAHHVRSIRSPAYWLHRLGGRGRTMVHGRCAGAGIELPAFTGTVIATPDTTVELPEVAMGLVPGAGGTVSIPRRIGRHRTAWMALTGDPIDAEQGRRWGLFDRVEPAA